MVTYPFQTDQFLWTKVAGDFGIGPGFTARTHNLTTNRLVTDLKLVMQPRFTDKAEAIAEQVRAEDGLSVQLSAIESIIEHTRHGGRPADWRMPSTPTNTAG
jgi:UDP:flavonoid glycosyltransferase YjiC (YdhE family)